MQAGGPHQGLVLHTRSLAWRSSRSWAKKWTQNSICNQNKTTIHWTHLSIMHFLHATIRKRNCKTAHMHLKILSHFTPLLGITAPLHTLQYGTCVSMLLHLFTMHLNRNLVKLAKSYNDCPQLYHRALAVCTTALRNSGCVCSVVLFMYFTCSTCTNFLTAKASRWWFFTPLGLHMAI